MTETAVVYSKVLYRNIVEETEENPEKLIQRVRSAGRDSNLPLLERKQELMELNLDWSFTVTRMFLRGHAVAQWLRHCATNRKVVSEFFIDIILPTAL
jgi:hypothetical protein